jgi:hypothetical protein
MTLIRKLQDIVLDPGQPAHQAITGTDAYAQAGDYARALISVGRLKSTPVILDCHQSMNEFMVEQAFKDAKGGLLIVDGIESLARHEKFVAEAERALDKGKTIIVLCGPQQAMDIFFADEPDLKTRFPAPVDMDSPEIKTELTARAEAEKAAAIESATVVQTPLQPMKPIKFK